MIVKIYAKDASVGLLVGYVEHTIMRLMPGDTYKIISIPSKFVTSDIEGRIGPKSEVFIEIFHSIENHRAALFLAQELTREGFSVYFHQSTSIFSMCE